MGGFSCIIVVLSLGLYITTCRNGFTFDDFHKILENSTVTSPDWQHPLSFFVPGADGVRSPDRAIPQITYAVNYALHGDRPFGYHLVNVVLHACVSVMVYAVVLLLFSRRRLAFLTAVLFAVHPIHTDVVASVIGRGELLSSLCFLIGLWVYVRSTASERSGWSWGYWSTIPFLVIGAFSKETASWSLPFVAGAVDVYRFGVRGNRSVSEYLPVFARRFVLFYLPYLAVLAVIVVFSLSTTSPPELTANYLAFLTPAERLLEAMGIFMRYVVLLVWPFRLSCDYSYSQLFYHVPWIRAMWIAGGAIMAVVAGATAVVSLRRKGQHFVGLSLFAVNYLIVSNLILVINVSMAERLVYSASIGFCLCAGLVCDRLLLSPPHRKRMVSALVICVVVSWSIRTWTRNDDWENNFTLFSAAYRVCPMSSRVNYNCGVEYAERNDLDHAVQHYERAVRIVPWHPKYHLSLGDVYLRQGHKEKAREAFATACRLAPDYGDAFINLGGVLTEMGEFPKAFKCLRIARELSPDNWRAWYNMGDLSLAAGYMDQALRNFERTTALNSRHHGAWLRLGVVHLRQYSPRQAISCLEKAVALFPDYKEAHNNLGLAFGHIGNTGKAEQAFREALRIDPNFALARNNLERLLRLRTKQRSSGVK